MGRAYRWLKGLFGIKKEKKRESIAENVDATSSMSSDNRKEKKRWSFGKSTRNYQSCTSPEILASRRSGNAAGRDNDWLRSYLTESEREQNKHAITVAAATAAAADAAVAAAQAAVAVVRLTSRGRGTLLVGGTKRWAAIRIQCVFRGYLARKALRALRGLVKLQALVRGYLVRKQMAATINSMEALIRAQSSFRAAQPRSCSSQDKHIYRIPHEPRARKSVEVRGDERSGLFNSSRRIPAPCEMTPMMATTMVDENTKIVEIDTCKPRSRSRKFIGVLCECGEGFPCQAISSPILPFPNLSQICVRKCKTSRPDCRWCLDEEDESRYSTTQCTPRFSGISMRSSALDSVSPHKSSYGDAYLKHYPYFPNYMTSTQSFKAKLRSHSAPRQRPDNEPKKRFSLSEAVATRNSVSGTRMERSCCSTVNEDEGRP